MTYDGSLNTSTSNSVRIPNIRSLASTGYYSGPGSSGPANVFWGDDKYQYSMRPYGLMSRSDATNPASFYSMSSYNSTVYSTSGTNCPLYVTPTAIGDYYYALGSTDDLGGTSGVGVMAAHVSTPMIWESPVGTGAGLAHATQYGALYNDGTYLWIFGGNASFDGVANYIQRAAVSDPTTWTNVGTLPAGKFAAGFTVIGSTLYLYGGQDETLTSTNTIFTASTSDPTTWTLSSDHLPSAAANLTCYNDGTNVYLLGAHDSASTQTGVYTASISTPTNFTVADNLVNGTGNPGKIYVANNRVYFIYTGGVQSAPVSDLTSWTDSSLSLASSTAQPMVGVYNQKIYVIGGVNSSNASSNIIQSADFVTPDSFTNVGTLPAALAGGTLIKTSTSFYIIGGDGTTGNYYRADLTAPTTWTAIAGGPSQSRGSCFIRNGVLWYVGGETTPTSDSNIIYRANIRGGSIIGWETAASVFGLASSIARASLFVAGDYVYIINGVSGGVNSRNIFRARTDDMASGWTSMGTLPVAFNDATTVLLNDYIYIMGGVPTGPTTSNGSTGCFYASMLDLANGIINFTYETNFLPSQLGGSPALCVNDTIWTYGFHGTSGAGTKTIYRTGPSNLHSLAMPRIPESAQGYATIDNLTGTLGTYSSFQKLGMLPWLVTSH